MAFLNFTHHFGPLTPRTKTDWNWPPPRALVSSIAGALSKQRSMSGANAFATRLDYVLATLFSFAALSGMTAVLIRVMLTSGVALGYPAARGCAALCGGRGATDARDAAWRRAAAVLDADRTLNAAYPWLGAHIASQRRRAADVVALAPVDADAPDAGAAAGAGDNAGRIAPFVRVEDGGDDVEEARGPAGGGPPANGAVAVPAPAGAAGPPIDGGAIGFLFANSVAALFLFIGMQVGGIAISGSTALGGKSMPADFAVDVWSVFFFAELFALIFCRSEATMYFFPRAFALSYFALCAYIVATPYAFFTEASSTWAFGVFSLCFHMVAVPEALVMRDARLSIHRPRALLSRIPAPQPVAPAAGLLPPLWTVFLPLDTYMAEHVPGAPPVPPRPGPLVGPGEGGDENAEA